MGQPAPAPGAFYRPAEVAAMLRCSEWWVKEQARNRRIPFCWIGGSYLFTAEHVAEIVHLFEIRPVEAEPATQMPLPRRGPAVREIEEPRQLRARAPRRVRGAPSGSSAA